MVGRHSGFPLLAVKHNEMQLQVERDELFRGKLKRN